MYLKEFKSKYNLSVSCRKLLNGAYEATMNYKGEVLTINTKRNGSWSMCTANSYGGTRDIAIRNLVFNIRGTLLSNNRLLNSIAVPDDLKYRGKRSDNYTNPLLDTKSLYDNKVINVMHEYLHKLESGELSFNDDIYKLSENAIKNATTGFFDNKYI